MTRAALPAARLALRLLDVAGLAFAFTVAAWLAREDAITVPLAEALAMRVSVLNFFLFAGLAAAWSAALSAFGLYDLGIGGSRQNETRDLVAAVSAAAALLWLFRDAFDIALVGAEFTIDFWLVALVLLIGSRIALRFLLRAAWRGQRARRHLLIVGTNRRALSVANEIRTTPELGFHLVGLVDDEWAGARSARAANLPVVTDCSHFSDFLASHVVDDVMVCLPVRSLYECSSELVRQCQEQGVTAHFVSDVYTPTLGRAHVRHFGDRLVVTIATGGLTGPAARIKALLDRVVALLALVACAPLLLAISVAIELTSPGPALFVQERMGLNKRRFRLYKFRTMSVDAEQQMERLLHLNEAGGPVFKLRADPRVTRIGQWLRSTSLDELPQLWNVLVGDMSLVGPRPLPVRDFEGFSTAWHRRRFSVKPGITCLWQVHGRSSIPFDQWMELDMQYIDQWSLRLDFEILLKTIPAVLRRGGAY